MKTKVEKMKILATGDWHIGFKIGGYDFLDDIIKMAEIVVDRTSEFDLFVHLGDVFHSNNPSPKSMAAAIDVFHKVKCPSVIIAGNHDIIRNDERIPDALEPLRVCFQNRKSMTFPVLPLVRRYDDFLFVFVGHQNELFVKRRYGKTVTAGKLIQKTFIKYHRKADVFFSHLDVPQAIPGSEKGLSSLSYSLPSEWIDYKGVLVNGHIHNRQFIKPNIHLPGSIVATDFTGNDTEFGYFEMEL